MQAHSPHLPDLAISVTHAAACRRGTALARSAAALLTLLLAAQLWAAPAPWYWWRSKVDGVRICAQTSPGTGWERDSAPYAGPGCAPKPRVFVIPMR